MQYKVGTINVPPKNKYPYLATDPQGRMVLVGRYSAIMLDPKENGNSYTYPSGEEAKARLTRAHEGLTVTLTQEKE